MHLNQLKHWVSNKGIGGETDSIPAENKECPTGVGLEDILLLQQENPPSMIDREEVGCEDSQKLHTPELKTDLDVWSTNPWRHDISGEVTLNKAQV